MSSIRLHKVLLLVASLLTVALGLHCYDVPGQNPQEPTYYKALTEWRENRIHQLTAADGWTTLAGLFWLENGINSFGSGPDKDLIFPDPLPPDCGEFILEDDSVYYRGDHFIEVNGAEVNEGKGYLMYADGLNPIPNLSWKSMKWFVIKRGPKFAIRLRDSLRSSRFALTEIPHYANDMDWNMEATISYQDTQHILAIDNMVGITNHIKVAATLTFQIDQQVYELYAIPGGPDRYFVIFADETTGDGTYHGGRYLYPEIPKQGNITFLDFNRAINPPCVFTEFATCPLPPSENILPFAVLAGEKYLSSEM